MPVPSAVPGETPASVDEVKVVVTTVTLRIVLLAVSLMKRLPEASVEIACGELKRAAVPTPSVVLIWKAEPTTVVTSAVPEAILRMVCELVSAT